MIVRHYLAGGRQRGAEGELTGERIHRELAGVRVCRHQRARRARDS